MNNKTKAKIIQGYFVTCQGSVNSICVRCKNYKSTFFTVNGLISEKKIKCGIGGFGIRRNGTCNRFCLITTCYP